ncbi:7495_t:CDS:2 [Acaulospora colombiana]|uniref:7495_t:CDS:1 n=1 Tax=Acaulospora colombiana TaxID=27376 RepID=A0ACA9M4K8_9GLOM|nr:7495_t:CDS:2 [Acaulospora colombiana]
MSIATYIITHISGHPIEPLANKNRDALYARMHRDLLNRERRTYGLDFSRFTFDKNMNITEEKWPIQQTSQASQSPRQAHPSLSPQMNGISTEPFMPPFSYEGQTSQGQIQSSQM